MRRLLSLVTGIFLIAAPAFSDHVLVPLTPIAFVHPSNRGREKYNNVFATATSRYHVYNHDTFRGTFACTKLFDKKKDAGGYKFGDFTKGLMKKVTKKEDYKFGDLSRHLDSVAKQTVADFTKKEKYEFGDLSRYVDSKVKGSINDFTNSTKYEFGDVSKEIAGRVATHDYTLDDLIFLIKILLAFGAGLSPVANFLPAKLLIQLLDVSIAGDVTNKVVAAITTELDKRFKKAFTGDPNYQMGDLSKQAVLDYIGKDEYEFGDVTKFVLDKTATGNDGSDNGNGGDSDGGPILKGSLLGDNSADSDLIALELQEWDKNFLVQIQDKDDKTDSSKSSTSPAVETSPKGSSST